LTGGGGAYGPLTNLNAEIYFPDYLFASDGTLAPRPGLGGLPGLPNYVSPGSTVSGVTDPATQISRVTLLRTGSSTHSNNSDQRFLDLPFSQQGASFTAQLPGDPTIIIPGFWIVFVWGQNGVPSIGKIIHVSL
jgi:hypothetical protein